ncbi:branched-chain amino acid ABC transporter permease [Desulfomicrobium escambiense]|uniref:branched-chain amino acid ABC transporter permease n=1 Tax=Desulfomicrobium escambiense TaxID=29503 RepID=UPI00048CC9BD|nr:branched-chain amino acid ABC transporter permease [Desulfomicrobium escambiense]
MSPRLTTPAALCAMLLGLVAMTQTGLLGQYAQTFLCTMGIYMILAASLNLVNGYMGEFSCGHAGFMAVGAYTASIVGVILFVGDEHLGPALLPMSLAPLAFPLILATGFAAAALVGLLVAIPSFKTRGDYLAVITLAAGYIVKSALENIEIVGGPRGFMGMKKVVLSIEESFTVPWMLVWIFIGVVLTIWLLRRFVYSTYGKGVMAIHQDEVAAEIMSVNTNHMKLVAFMLSSGLAGLAGGLYAYLIGFVNPASFTILRSTECLVMVYLGGMGSLTGSILAAGIFTILLEFLKPLEQLKWVAIPMLLIVLMQFRPEGLMGNRELSDIFPKLKRFYRFK